MRLCPRSMASKNPNSGCLGILLVFGFFAMLFRGCGDESPQPDSRALATVTPARFESGADVHAITGEAVYFRDAPNSTGGVLGSFAAGDSVQLLGTEGGEWSHVQARDGRQGYVSNQFLSGVAYEPPPKPTTHRRDVATAPVAQVYICNSSSAYAYHSYESCSGLNRCTHGVSGVSVTEAEGEGRTPCRKCH